MPKNTVNSRIYSSGRGFTLIELLVAVAILAIIAVAGLVVYTGAQKNARDGKRRLDIEAIASALETNKNTGSSAYAVLADSQFASGSIPQDSGNGNAKYCAVSIATGSLSSAPTIWTNSDPCPANYNPISNTNPADVSVAWRICALLENGSNPTNIYCKINRQ